MPKTFIIAEGGSSHGGRLDDAYRLIEAAKECGADAFKAQFWSSSHELAERRNATKEAERMYEMYRIPQGWLPLLKERCDKVGIEFMCTAFLIDDIGAVDPFVKRFKVSAFESQWREFISAHCEYAKSIIISVNEGHQRLSFCQDSNFLYCVSKYPTHVEDLHLSKMKPHDGLSDHTTSMLTGALAVAKGAPIIEKHIRLRDTSEKNPDHPHSLIVDVMDCDLSDGQERCVKESPGQFYEYVSAIREAEKAL